MSIFLIPCPRALAENRGALPGTWSSGILKQLPLIVACVRVVGESHVMQAEPGPEIRASDIRPLLSIGNARIGQGEGDGLSRIAASEDAFERPAAHDRIQHPVHVSTHPPLAPERQIVHSRQHKALRRVIGPNRVFRSQVIDVLRISQPDPSKKMKLFAPYDE